MRFYKRVQKRMKELIEKVQDIFMGGRYLT